MSPCSRFVFYYSLFFAARWYKSTLHCLPLLFNAKSGLESGQILLGSWSFGWTCFNTRLIFNVSLPQLIEDKQKKPTEAHYWRRTKLFALIFLTLISSPNPFSGSKIWRLRLEKMGMAAADARFHILAVDDSLIDRKLIERLFKTSSFQVTTVDSGSKALEFLGWHEDDGSYSNEASVSQKGHQEVEVNLVITDYCMPGMTGYDLLKKIKESSSLRNIPVAIMSSENVPSRITRCLEEGAEEFFLKPVRRSDVNKLMPHMMKAKCKMDFQEKSEKQEKPENKDSEAAATAESDIHLKTAQPQLQLQQQPPAQTNNNNSTKRKAMEEGLSPDRTRPRINGLTVMSS